MKPEVQLSQCVIAELNITGVFYLQSLLLDKQCPLIMIKISNELQYAPAGVFTVLMLDMNISYTVFGQQRYAVFIAFLHGVVFI